MAAKYYPALGDGFCDARNWSITFLDFRGVTPVAAIFVDVMRRAEDALASAVEDMEKERGLLLWSVEEEAVPDYDRSAYNGPRAIGDARRLPLRSAILESYGYCWAAEMG